MANDAQTEHQCAAEKNLQQDNGGKAVKRLALPFLEQCNSGEEYADHETEQAEPGDELERNGGEGGDVAQGIAQEAKLAPAAVAAGSFGNIERNAGCRIIHPLDQTTKETPAFRQLAVLIDDFPVKQLVVRLTAQVEPGQRVKKKVEAGGKKTTTEAFLPTACLVGFNDFGSATPELNHWYDQFRWMLQIAVEQNDCIRVGMVKPCLDGRFLAKVARKPQPAGAWFLRTKIGQCICRSVG